MLLVEPIHDWSQLLVVSRYGVGLVLMGLVGLFANPCRVRSTYLARTLSGDYLVSDGSHF